MLAWIFKWTYQSTNKNPNKHPRNECSFGVAKPRLPARGCGLLRKLHRVWKHQPRLLTVWLCKGEHVFGAGACWDVCCSFEGRNFFLLHEQQAPEQASTAEAQYVVVKATCECLYFDRHQSRGFLWRGGEGTRIIWSFCSNHFSKRKRFQRYSVNILYPYATIKYIQNDRERKNKWATMIICHFAIHIYHEIW